MSFLYYCSTYSYDVSAYVVDNVYRETGIDSVAVDTAPQQIQPMYSINSFMDDSMVCSYVLLLSSLVSLRYMHNRIDKYNT